MRKLLLILAVVPTLLLAACSGGGSSDAGAGHDDADVTFAQQMIPHHQQAVAMAQLVPDADASPEVTALAEQISAAQEPEIDQMQGWLDDWGAGEASHDMDHDMEGMDMGDGMASDADLARLGTLKGAAFDTLWLQLMTAHHEGAITMAQTEVDSGRNADATNLATQIIVAQQAEIETMKALLR